jgi:hypothetical protein
MSCVITFILTISNYLAYPLLSQLYIKDLFGFWLALCGVLASTAYHSAEIKFGLTPLIYLSHNTVNILLNLDRFFACSSIVYFISNYDWYCHMYLICIALAFNGGSELIGRAGYLKLFCLTHLIWHFLAYFIGYVIVLDK